LRRHRSIRSAVGDRRGGVLVTFALFAPVLILMMSFVLDVGNLFVLQRHLQVQADAGALAAAQDFTNCNDATITSDVQKYSGFTASSYNGQVGGGAGGILEAINSTTYPGPVPGTPDNTNTAAPCAAQQVDVKISDTNIPWYFQPFSPASINAHARVQVNEETSIGPGGAPFAISDPSPRSAAACFVDEASGALLAGTSLTQNGSTWSNASTPLAVTINKPNVAVRVALSGNANTSCSDPAATFYDLTGTTTGILHIQGYSNNNVATVSAPVAHQVVLLPGDSSGCSDQYFSDPSAACDVGIQATVDYGTATKPAGATVNAVVNGTSYPLTFMSTSGNFETWTTTTGKFLSLPAQNGPNAVTLKIASTGHSTVTTSKVQSSYTAGANSGPITAAGVSENGVSDANSFRLCETGNPSCTHNLVVTLIMASLTTGPLQHLSVANGGVNCPGASDFAGLIATGCQGNYALYTGGTCVTIGPAPITCVNLQNGVKANQIASGLNQRILGSSKPSTCTHPNNWGLYPNLPAGDPRILTVFITSFGGTNNLQIEAFATFYLTGWAGSGGGFTNPCQPPPATWNGSLGGDDAAQGTTLVGHFITYVNVLGGGGGSACLPNSLNQCTAVLTR
jgi:hypothetical protein